MVKNDPVTSVISVISVLQVGIGWIQPREYSNTISQLYVRRYGRCTDSVNVFCADGLKRLCNQCNQCNQCLACR